MSTDKETKENGKLPIFSVRESLLFGEMEVSPIDKDGDFEITMEHYDGNASHYLTTEDAKLLIAFLQQGLNSR